MPRPSLPLCVGFPAPGPGSPPPARLPVRRRDGRRNLQATGLARGQGHRSSGQWCDPATIDPTTIGSGLVRKASYLLPCASIPIAPPRGVLRAAAIHFWPFFFRIFYLRTHRGGGVLNLQPTGLAQGQGHHNSGEWCDPATSSQWESSYPSPSLAHTLPMCKHRRGCLGQSHVVKRKGVLLRAAFPPNGIHVSAVVCQSQRHRGM